MVFEKFFNKDNVYSYQFRDIAVPGEVGIVTGQTEHREQSVKVSVKNQKNIVNLLELFEKWLIYKCMKCWIIFDFF